MTFQPGVSGNPSGRPKGSVSLITLLRQKLSEPGEDGKSRAEKIVDALIREAEGGDYRHIKEVIDRIDGKTAETHELTGKDGGAIAHRVERSPSLSGLTDAELRQLDAMARKLAGSQCDEGPAGD